MWMPRDSAMADKVMVELLKERLAVSGGRVGCWCVPFWILVRMQGGGGFLTDVWMMG